MIHPARRIACLAPVLATAALSAGACSSPQVHCPCEPSEDGYVRLPSEAGSTPISSVVTEPPCTADGRETGAVRVSRQSAGSCPVRVQLVTGQTYDFSVAFDELTTGCCQGLVYVVDASAPMSVDAAAD